MGTACTRADERMAAALGLMKSALTRFERCRDVDLGRLLAGLPWACYSFSRQDDLEKGGFGRKLGLPPLDTVIEAEPADEDE